LTSMITCNTQPAPVARSINPCLLRRILAIAEKDIEFQHFKHPVEYCIAVCKECRHSVLHSYIKSHLQRAHKVKQRQAEEIAEQVRSWLGLMEYASEIQVPTQVVAPIS
jgi:hypothetical protein